MTATTATRRVTEPDAFARPTAASRSGRSVTTAAAARLGEGRPRLRIVVEGEQAPVITRIAPVVAPASPIEPTEAPLRRIALDEFFAPAPGGESQTLVVARARPARLTQRGRVVVAALSLALTLGVGVLWASGSAATDHPQQTRVVMVGTGDTLWDISSRAADGGDVRTMMGTIERLNHLDSSVLQAGQRLRVPLS